MFTSQTSTLHQTVSTAVFEQLRALLQQMADTIDTKTVVLNETTLSVAGAEPSAEFLLLASKPFSALLSGTLSASETGASSYPRTYQICLQFEPAAIDTFIETLRDRLPARKSGRSSLRQAQSLLQPNDAAIQSDFTLRLIALLTASPATLHQQLEQERLLNQVTMQIRQSLELPIILQTAVEQACQFLQVSRLVIYQLNMPANFPGSVSVAATSVAATSMTAASVAAMSAPALLSGGVVTYEARASEAVASVLHLVEDCNLLQKTQRISHYRQGFTLAVEDVERTYTSQPCLLKFLRQAQVRAKLVAPIEVQGQLWGLLIAHQCQEPRQWQDSEQRFLQQIGEHLAIAITQAQLYAQVQQHNQTLEQRVAEQTQNLRDALMVAQAANQSKSEFLSAMSHELRSPLTMVIGMSATLLRWSFGELSQRQRHYLETIHNSGEHLLHLINDILDLSQLEAGKTVLKLSDFSLAQLARQGLRAIQEKAALAEVTLKLDLRTEEGDRFRADPRRVQQILLNLLSNAIKFTPEGGKVTLRVFADQHAAVVQVKDTGIGISQQQQSLLFHKFQQLDTSHHRQYEGAGVGLALTKQLVELHGGSISVESKVGLGSIFTVRIPRASQPVTPLVPSDSKSDALSGRIVLIESEEESAGIVCDMLTAAGYQVIWLVDGSTALSQIKIIQPIAIILAAESPHIDGYSILRQLRENPATQNLKTIVLTNATAEDQNRCMAIGATHCLPKPIQPDELLQQAIGLTINGEGESDIDTEGLTGGWDDSA